MTNSDINRKYNAITALKAVSWKYLGLYMKFAVWRNQLEDGYIEVQRTVKEMQESALKAYIDRVNGEIDLDNPPKAVPPDTPEFDELDKAIVEYSAAKSDKKIKIKGKIPYSWLEAVKEDSKVIPDVDALAAILEYVEDPELEPVPEGVPDEESP